MKSSIWVGALSALGLSACGPPHDYALVRRFQKQRAAFEELRVAACKLPLWQHINSGLTDPALDDSHQSWFLTKMRNVGVEDMVVQGKSPNCTVQLGVWAAGFAGTPAEYKNYRYTTSVPPKDTTATMQGLDHPPNSDQIQVLERPLGRGEDLTISGS